MGESHTERILSAAERILYHEGFHGTGMDRLIAAAGVSPRTLYRRFRSKDALVRAVLERREARFLGDIATCAARLEARGQGPLRAYAWAYLDWLVREGSEGCMFLKAYAEYAAHEPAVAAFVAQHKRRVLEELGERAEREGRERGGGASVQLMLLLEGATALGPILGPSEAAEQARSAAAALLGTVDVSSPG